MNYRYNYLVMGGTFDLLHLGHQAVLEKAFENSRFVTIGLTSDQFNKTRGKESFQNQNTRMNNLRTFLKKKSYLKRYKIVLINDIYGTTLEDPKLEAIVVTQENMHIVKLINKKRVAASLKPLQIIIVPHLKDEEGKIISSTRIRKGQIDPQGRSYKKLLLKMAGKRLPKSIRAKLKKPLGAVFSSPNHPRSPNLPTVSVGDVTTANLIKIGLSPKLAIIDGRVERKKIFMDPAPESVRDDKVKNPPGQISKALILTIDHSLRTTNYELRTILVNGEEDLATIPAILLSPLGTRVYYGQPHQGLVEVKVDLTIKNRLIRILSLLRI